MNINEKSKIIERIQTLMALGDASKNPYEEEVKTALNMAQNLMKKHNLTLSDIEIKKSSDDSIGTTNSTKHGHITWWERELAKLVAKLFNCQYLLNQGYYHNNSILFVGFKDEAQLANITFDILQKVISFRSMLKYKGHRLERNAYLSGILQCLTERIQQETFENTTEETNITAIVVAKDQRIKCWIDKEFKISHSHYKIPIQESMVDFFEGYMDGKKLDLNNKKKLNNRGIK